MMISNTINWWIFGYICLLRLWKILIMRFWMFMISSHVRMSALVSWWSQRLLHKHSICDLIPGRRTRLSLLTTKNNNQSSGDKSTDRCCLDLARDLPWCWFCPFRGLSLPFCVPTSTRNLHKFRSCLWRMSAGIVARGTTGPSVPSLHVQHWGT